MLGPLSDEHLSFFTRNQEAFYFEEVSEAAEESRKLLMMSKEKANLYRERARKRAVQEPYFYRDRMLEILQHMQRIVDCP